MSFQRRPSNYYDMDYEQRREWDKANQEMADLDHERRRAIESANEASDYADGQRKAAVRVRQEFAAREDEYETALSEVRAERDALLQAARGALGYLRSLSADHRPDESWFAPLEAAIAKAEETNQ